MPTNFYTSMGTEYLTSNNFKLWPVRYETKISSTDIATTVADYRIVSDVGSNVSNIYLKKINDYFAEKTNGLYKVSAISNNTGPSLYEPYNNETTTNISVEYSGTAAVNNYITVNWAVHRAINSPASMIRALIAARQAPYGFVRHQAAPKHTTDPREQAARETLRLILGDEQFFRFLSRGFVVVQNRKSGRTYQMWPGHEMVRVWEKGKCIQRLCVLLEGNFPPTDTLIVRTLMVLNNEEQLWKLANKYPPFTESQLMIRSMPDMRPLPQIMKALKAA
jgi:hypothetical protein